MVGRKLLKKRKQSQMNKQPITLRTYLPRGAFLLSLAFVIVMPVAVWNGVIYIAGGEVSYCAINTVRAYNIATDTWSTLAPMPTAVFLAGFGIINGKLYVASGNECEGEVADLQIYDIATNTWSRGAPVPTPVTGPGSAVYQGKLYLFGGGAPFGRNTTATQIYDPGTNSWTTGPSMNVARLW